MGGKKRLGSGVKVGEVYAGRVRDGRHACVHVIRRVRNGDGRGNDSVLLALLRYLGDGVPAIDHPDVRQLLLTRNRFGEDEYFVHWTEKSPPSDYVLIGSYQPTSEERAIDPMGSYGPHWSLEAVYSQSDPVRASADLEAGVGEATEQSALVHPEPGARMPTRGATLDATAFWQVISAVSPDEPDEDRSIRAAVRRLTTRSRADIIEFEEMMAEALHRLDTQEHAVSAGAAGSSGDAFLYARCYVLARGRAFYEDVLANPSRFPQDGDFEPLLSIASAAFEAKTGRAFEHDAQLSYETGANQKGWE